MRCLSQVVLALAGTQFTLGPGPSWFAAIPRHAWPEEMPTGFVWDAKHGDRRTELVCIGRELDQHAARRQLEACLLTDEEMAGGYEKMLALTDPLTRQLDGHDHAHDHTDDGPRPAPPDPLGGVAEADLRAMMNRAIEQGLPMHEFLGDVFEVIFDENAVQQIQACAPVLHEALNASDDRRRAQQKMLEGVVGLVNAPKGVSNRGEQMLQQTSTILMALYAAAPLPTHSPSPFTAQHTHPVGPSRPRADLPSCPTRPTATRTAC